MASVRNALDEHRPEPSCERQFRSVPAQPGAIREPFTNFMPCKPDNAGDRQKEDSERIERVCGNLRGAEKPAGRQKEHDAGDENAGNHQSLWLFM
jgi:hypothetical protein